MTEDEPHTAATYGGEVLPPITPDRVQVQLVEEPYTSPEVGKLFGAMAQAQAEIGGAHKSQSNEYFGSQYADLASVWDACRQALSKAGLCVIQTPASDDESVSVTTTLGHGTGQWMRCRVRGYYPFDDDGKIKRGPQIIGTIISYLRRYSLAAMCGVAQIDDDGQLAEGQSGKGKPRRKTKPFDSASAAGPPPDGAPSTVTGTNACPDCGSAVKYFPKKKKWICANRGPCGHAFPEDHFTAEEPEPSGELPKLASEPEDTATATDQPLNAWAQSLMEQLRGSAVESGMDGEAPVRLLASMKLTPLSLNETEHRNTVKELFKKAGGIDWMKVALEPAKS
jgi:hypothetical protein